MPEKFEKEKTTKKPEEILRTIKWEGGEAFIQYAEEEDRVGIIAADKDRGRYRREKYNVIKTQQVIEKESTRPLEERMADDKFIFLVLKIGGEVVGYIELRNVPESEDKTASIDTLSVLEKYFRNKFGTNLLEQGIEEAQKVFGTEHIHLWTNEKNDPATQLYGNLKSGFERTGERRVNEGETWVGEPSISIGFVKHLKKGK